MKLKKIKEQWEDYLENFSGRYGEGTKFDLDQGKLVIIFLCIYIAVQVS